MHEGGSNQADLRPYLRAFWLRKWLFLAIFLSIPAAVYGISTQIEETYEAETTLQVRATSVDAPLFSDQVNVSTSTVDAAVELISTTAVARQALSELDQSGDPRELLDQIEVGPLASTTGESSDLIAINATANDPAQAAAIANAFARAVDQIRAQSAVEEINQTIAELEEQRDNPEVATDEVAVQSLSEQIQQLRGIRAAQQNNAETIEPAFPPSEPVAPNPVRNTALAGVLSLLLGLGAVALAVRLDHRLRTPEEVEPIIGAPLLSVIPSNAFPGKPPNPSAVQESFQTLQASLTYFNVDRPLKSVMVASPLRGDGKTTVADYLAIALARDGKDAVLVDCDMRRPQAAERVGIHAETGLAQVLIGETSIDDALIDLNLQEGRFRVLPAGASPPNPARLLNSDAFQALLRDLEQRADVVVLDTPPMLTVSDAVPLLERVSGTVMVAHLDNTSRDALARMREIIESARGSVLGSAVTGAKTGGLYGYGYYGYYGSGYGQGDASVAATSNGEVTVGGGESTGRLARARRRLTRSN